MEVIGTAISIGTMSLVFNSVVYAIVVSSNVFVGNKPNESISKVGNSVFELIPADVHVNDTRSMVLKTVNLDD